MSKVLRKGYVPIFPLPVVLVSCGEQETGFNIITIAWTGVLATKPPTVYVSIREDRHSYRIIDQSGEFVINIPNAEQVEKVDAVGMVSGKDVDKFETFGFTPDPGSVVKAPVLRECPVNFECKVLRTIPFGSHVAFIGEVKTVHVEESVLKPNDKIDFEKLSPVAYNQGQYWSLGKLLGKYGFSGKEG